MMSYVLSWFWGIVTSIYLVTSNLSSIILVFVFIPISCFSQDFQIEARIVDSSSLRPISFVTIYDSKSRGTISDDLGFFRFQIAKENLDDSLYLTCVGYRPIVFSVRDIELNYLDTIFMSQHLVELEPVEVSAEFRKAPRAKQIIRKAISTIPENFPNHSVLYNGYYREYIKEQENYVNLLESIIELEDPGFSYPDDFSSGLLYKRMNPEFKIDKDLMRPYDNVNKFIPYSIAPTTSGNEMVLLRSHDPIRNYDKPALYFIDCFESSFIMNHIFNIPKLTYFNERPYYQITYQNKKNKIWGNAKIFATGTIFIDALNFGIKKINYKGYAESTIKREKLFELNLEYSLENDQYHLHYLSFNNLFKTRNFCVRNIEFDVDAVLISFSQSYNPQAAINKDNYRVFWKGQEMIIKKIGLEKEVDRIRLILLNGEKIQNENLRHDLDSRKGRVSMNDNKFILDNLDIEIANITDISGNPLKSTEFNDYYQYRELFVRGFSMKNTLITKNLIDKKKPVFSTQIFGAITKDTSWLNTPLISEKTNSRTIKIDTKVMQSGLENMYMKNEKTRTDIVYINTDREVYAPNDTLWFKAYIRNKADLQRSDRSQTFYFNLINSEGTIVQNGRLFINESDVSGQLHLDLQLPEGIYYLTGYSSWMRNFSTDEIFSKQILIKKDIRDDFQLVASYNKNTFFPGDTVKISIQCLDELDKEVMNVKYSYRLISGRDILLKGDAFTSGSGENPLIFIIPENISELPEIKLSGNYKRMMLDTVYTLPINYDVHVEFFPEGGHLINGIKSRIAYKSLTSRGMPIEIYGDVIDQDGTIIQSIKSEHDGMGVFTVTPKNGRKLSLKLIRPIGVHNIFPLPDVTDSGWQIRAENKGDFINLTINRHNTKCDTALIIIRVRGYLCYYKQVVVSNRESHLIPLEDLPPGIVVITLYDNRMLPQAERLVFTSPPGEVSASMETKLRHYVPRDKVSLAISIQSKLPLSLEGSYSLTVIDDQLCSADFIDAPDIRTSFLITPEIRGKIHNADYYMKTGMKVVQKHLDILLMTQGWRDYEYSDTMNWLKENNAPRNMEVISGKLLKQEINRNDEPVQGLLSVYYRGESRNIPIDRDGEFSFLSEYYPQSTNSLLLSAMDDKGKDNVSICMDSSIFDRNLPKYLKSYSDRITNRTTIPVLTYTNIFEQFSLRSENHKWIEEVKILGQKKKEFDYFESTLASARTPGKLDMENSLDPFEILLNMGLPVQEIIIDTVSPLPVVKYYGFPWDDDGEPATVMWMVDELQWDYMAVKYLNPEDIESLFVVFYPETQSIAMLMENRNERGPERVNEHPFKVPKVIASIYTKPHSEREHVNRSNSFFTPRFTISKKFYTPVYETDEVRNSTIPDLRKTIHWEPDLKINEDGTATVNFYNGDRYTRIKCILEGITDSGVPIYSEHSYNVSLMRE